MLSAAQLKQNIADYSQQTGKYVPMSKGDFLWVKSDANGSLVRSKKTKPAPHEVTPVLARPQEPGWNVPLWCARLRADEMQDVQSPDDEFEVEWWGCFYYGSLRDSMNHAFKPICCGRSEPKKLTDGSVKCPFHAFGAWTNCKQKNGAPSEKHGPLIGTVTRNTIRLTTLGAHTLTDKGQLRSTVGTPFPHPES